MKVVCLYMVGNPPSHPTVVPGLGPQTGVPPRVTTHSRLSKVSERLDSVCEIFRDGQDTGTHTPGLTWCLVDLGSTVYGPETTECWRRSGTAKTPSVPGDFRKSRVFVLLVRDSVVFVGSLSVLGS